ncbi:hypothetical protein [Bacillus toyonensis]|uniref:hypothetical protein n=1 Tax=Bacillus toyonensis TaxID=155322 RepID=UPI001C0B9074|nr:hypothetical protein [Bacillus toyonensis]MBU4642986.1 hypothetical protein [Bacillus toyonensis]
MSEKFLKSAVFRKLILPPEEEFKGLEIKPSNYLISGRYGENCVLYREIKQDEKWDFEGGFVIAYQDKCYLRIADLPDEEHAMAAIRSYWRAIKELCDLTEGKQPGRENHDKYVEEAKRKNKKIAYSYGFNWHGFTYNGLKSDYCFDVTIKFNTCIFVEGSIDDVADYLSVSIDIQEEKLITQLDANSLFDSVEIIEFFIDDTNSKFCKKLSIEEGISLLNEFCRQAKANELPYLELTGEALAFKYVD